MTDPFTYDQLVKEVKSSLFYDDKKWKCSVQHTESRTTDTTVGLRKVPIAPPASTKPHRHTTIPDRQMDYNNVAKKKISKSMPILPTLRRPNPTYYIQQEEEEECKPEGYCVFNITTFQCLVHLFYVKLKLLLT